MVAGLGFDKILGDQGMRRMAVVAGGPLLVPGVVPAFVDSIHHMAVVAGGRVVAQVGGEIGDVQPHHSDCKQSKDGDEHRDLHTYLIRAS